MKKFIALLLAMLMLATLCACGDTEQPSGNNNTGNNNTGNNNSSDTTKFGIYDNEEDGISVIKIKGSDAPVSGIENAVSRWYYINKDGQYCTVDGTAVNLAATPAKLFTGNNEAGNLAYWDAEGNFYIGKSDVKFPIPSDGSLVGYSYHQADGYTFYFLRDGGIYRSLYASDGTAKDFMQNQRVYILYNEDDLEAVEPVISQCKFVVDGDNYAIAMLATDGTCYFTELSAVRSDFKVDGEYIYTFCCEIYENVDAIFDLCDNDHLYTPVYSKRGDTTHLYFSYTNDEYEDCNIAVALPEGYTTSDIKKVQMEWCDYSYDDNTALMLVQFANGSVYYLRTEDVIAATPDASAVSLVCHEKLTELGKAGHIRVITNYSHGSDWVALMDDSCTYRIKIK